MTLIDSSVWIDYFNGQVTAETNKLDTLLGVEPLGIGDLVLTEVLRGFRSDSDYQTAKKLMMTLSIFEMLGTDMAVQSADNFRMLRKRDITVRKTTNVIIATYCIAHNYSLLFADKDFLPFVTHLGLKTVTTNA
jgi:predicted nucleic acid-binding protein